jgi:hypothetical protein
MLTSVRNGHQPLASKLVKQNLLKFESQYITLGKNEIKLK